MQFSALCIWSHVFHCLCIASPILSQIVFMRSLFLQIQIFALHWQTWNCHTESFCSFIKGWFLTIKYKDRSVRSWNLTSSHYVYLCTFNCQDLFIPWTCRYPVLTYPFSVPVYTLDLYTLSLYLYLPCTSLPLALCTLYILVCVYPVFYIGS